MPFPNCENARRKDCRQSDVAMQDLTLNPTESLQNNFPLKLTPLEVNHATSPPPHDQRRSIVESPASEKLRQNLLLSLPGIPGTLSDMKGDQLRRAAYGIAWPRRMAENR